MLLALPMSVDNILHNKLSMTKVLLVGGCYVFWYLIESAPKKQWVLRFITFMQRQRQLLQWNSLPYLIQGRFICMEADGHRFLGCKMDCIYDNYENWATINREYYYNDKICERLSWPNVRENWWNVSFYRVNIKGGRSAVPDSYIDWLFTLPIRLIWACQIFICSPP